MITLFYISIYYYIIIINVKIDGWFSAIWLILDLIIYYLLVRREYFIYITKKNDSIIANKIQCEVIKELAIRYAATFASLLVCLIDIIIVTFNQKYTFLSIFMIDTMLCVTANFIAFRASKMWIYNSLDDPSHDHLPLGSEPLIDDIIVDQLNSYNEIDQRNSININFINIRNIHDRNDRDPMDETKTNSISPTIIRGRLQNIYQRDTRVTNVEEIKESSISPDTELISRSLLPDRSQQRLSRVVEPEPPSPSSATLETTDSE